MELRRYAFILIAETEVEGDLDQTSSQGFSIIDGYIFGDIQGPDAGQKARVTMTARVTAEPQS
jgi:SOUL heme-binding protein